MFTHKRRNTKFGKSTHSLFIGLYCTVHNIFKHRRVSFFFFLLFSEFISLSFVSSFPFRCISVPVHVKFLLPFQGRILQTRWFAGSPFSRRVKNRHCFTGVQCISASFASYQQRDRPSPPSSVYWLLPLALLLVLPLLALPGSESSPDKVLERANRRDGIRDK